MLSQGCCIWQLVIVYILFFAACLGESQGLEPAGPAVLAESTAAANSNNGIDGTDNNGHLKQRHVPGAPGIHHNHHRLHNHRATNADGRHSAGQQVDGLLAPSFFSSNGTAVPITDPAVIHEEVHRVKYPVGFTLVKSVSGVSRCDGDEAQQYIIDLLDLKSACASLGGQSAVVIDVGGAYGDFGMTAAYRGCQTIIFEPRPSAAMNIARSVQLNKLEAICSVRNEAVSTMPSVVIDNGGTQVSTQSDAKAIPGVRLDDIYPSNETIILLLKVDVEGFEGDVLETARKMFAAKRVKHAIWEYTPYHFAERTNWSRMLPEMQAYGARACYGLHRRQGIIYRIRESDFELFRETMKAAQLQTDIYCSFVDDVTISAADWTVNSPML
jgi:FkbM family methyltransferase